MLGSGGHRAGICTSWDVLDLPGGGGDSRGFQREWGGVLMYDCPIKSFCIAKNSDAVYFAADGVGFGRVLLCPVNGGLWMGGLQSCWFLSGCCSVLLAPGYILSNGGLFWVPTFLTLKLTVNT